ncbi:hypothetical protein BK708_17870 [Bacillus thuringiensis serovar yunnanensis]|nr:hypothetical protein BK708_30110 [Bacillus thuringiensis serovar yunnanensis]OUB10975.1 hypothetical protein BK708_30040 [Bacillus thuringiensis serovar yunnanensis]OUB20092.1 hypothetical protein BK708_19210 [Bacillus thuringiensis serovar yunnanensis]OUB21987.1 hypothetical protein BK708_17870 [Bacillus thuringiensis serovar yunnanensis]
MAKVFRLTLASIDRFAVAENHNEMYERRAEIEPTFAYTPVEIQEFQIPGYVIEAHTIPKEEPKPVEKVVKDENWIKNATKAELKEHLEEQDVEVKSKATLSELQELAAETV